MQGDSQFRIYRNRHGQQCHYCYTSHAINEPGAKLGPGNRIGIVVGQPPARRTGIAPRGVRRMSKHAALVPFITIALTASGDRPLYRQLYETLRTAILDGQIAAGSRLPSTRVLSELLHVSRFTVSTTFEQLQAEGFIRGEVGSGTYVSSEFVPRSAVHRSQSAARDTTVIPRPALSQRG